MAYQSYADLRDVVCGGCGRTFITKHPRKRFCDPCGVARRSGHAPVERPTRNEAIASIAAESSARRTSMVSALTLEHDFVWEVLFQVPFAAEMSKNRRWSNNGKSVVYLSREVRSYQDMLAAKTREALRNVTVRQNKLWVGLFVQKPNHRFDAINAVDTICDAIKLAAGLDDRWFCLERVDWEIKKSDPQIYIKIGQSSDEDVIVCSHCGDMKPAEDYPLRTNGPLGRSRVCRECAPKIERARPRRTGVPSHKLTADDVREIRRLLGTASQESIAEQFGVTVANISAIGKRRTWKDVD